MIQQRRTLFLGLLLSLFIQGLGSAQEFASDWPFQIDRVWPGPDYWSNPLQDWRVVQGRLECVRSGGLRNVRLLTREVVAEPGDLEVRVRLGALDPDEELTEGWVGFELGGRGQFDDYRDTAVRGRGLFTGLTTAGRLFIGQAVADYPMRNAPFESMELVFNAEPDGEIYRTSLQVLDGQGNKLTELNKQDMSAEWLRGSIALVCSAEAPPETPAYLEGITVRDWGMPGGTKRGGEVRFWFSDWAVSGSKVRSRPERAYGPILFTQYTLNRKVMKMCVQMAPVGQGADSLSLEIWDEDAWKEIAMAGIDPLALTALFRVPEWDDSRDVMYRVVYTPDWVPEESDPITFSGTVRKDPRDREKIVVAAFTGNHDFGFPHQELVAHVKHFDPDLLVFTGDQVYEPVGGYSIEREPLEPATLDYLRKWYIYGWSFRDLLRDRPSVCLPDDHDVYHGNIWGAGGKAAGARGMEGQDRGGYTMDADWVKMVHRTQTSHLPDPFDPRPVEQEIPVYFTELRVGGVSFAILEDRKWKSPPRALLPEAEIRNGWAQNPEYDAAEEGDAPAAVLLGERQLAFLEHWAADWSGGVWMKAAFSQTIFANVATLPQDSKSDAVTQSLSILPPGEYAEGEKIVMDHDSNGWPQTGRNRALRALRKGFSVHIAGDQHLASTVQYGVDEWNDAAYAICVPSISNIFPRRWYPPEPGQNRKEGSPPYTGEFKDGFGNRIFVHAVANPHSVGVEPEALNHRAPGYGIIAFDKSTRKITLTNWPRWVNPASIDAKPYPGWPVVCDQQDNYGRKAAAWLPRLEIEDMDDPVVQVLTEPDGVIVYTLRISGRVFFPKVFEPGTYTVKVGEPGTEDLQTIRGLEALAMEEAGMLRVHCRKK
ncbi:MAG: alkaline phosphatase D family protein [Planctomycetota bacterium]|jgi:hypothetical protein